MTFGVSQTEAGVTLGFGSASIRPGLSRAGILLPALFLTACAQPDLSVPPSASASADDRFPSVEVIRVFEPEGESNVRSSFQLADGIGLIGTEETGDIFKTEDGGLSWRKVWDGGARWGIADVRNFLRARDGHLYITTTEPATVARSSDEGISWNIVAEAPSSRTVGLVQLDNGVILVGLRRAVAKQTSIIRSEDNFGSFQWLPVSTTEPPQNVTCFASLGGLEVLAGVGYEGSGKVYKSTDGGLTWSKKAEFSEARDLMNFFIAGHDTYVLASGIATLFKSSDGGESWSEAHRFWPKGFLGQCVQYERVGRTYHLISATDQSRNPYRHVVLISDDSGATWYEWIELAQDRSGGASNLAVLSDHTIVVGTGNHSAQGRAYTLQVTD
jgi:photosystem II stability/assembly factor-like uncharacterized protein